MKRKLSFEEEWDACERRALREEAIAQEGGVKKNFRQLRVRDRYSNYPLGRKSGI